MKETYRSNGKLLITSEYLVLDGAEALAIPTKKGQTLEVKKTKSPTLEWKSYTVDGDIWFEAVFNNKLEIQSSSDEEIAKILLNFLDIACSLNPNFRNKLINVEVSTHLEFQQDWGLGSSSTLINNIAQWAEVDPFILQQKSFPGSGYDIACAFNNNPITYLLKDNYPEFLSVKFAPSFKDNIYFVHLNKKQNSRDEIQKYRKSIEEKYDSIEKANSLTSKFVLCEDEKTFRGLIAEHEFLISGIINRSPIKKELFPDYKGSIKSLGAWGGDFIMAVGKNTPEYFRKKGYNTIVLFSDMIY